jgi:Arc/MetJ-type ribon-helix-helix transcriptional regulator
MKKYPYRISILISDYEKTLVQRIIARSHHVSFSEVVRKALRHYAKQIDKKHEAK